MGWDQVSGGLRVPAVMPPSIHMYNPLMLLIP